MARTSDEYHVISLFNSTEATANEVNLVLGPGPCLSLATLRLHYPRARDLHYFDGPGKIVTLSRIREASMSQGQVVFSPEVSFLLPFLDPSVPYLVTEEDTEAGAETEGQQAVGVQEELRSCVNLLQSRVGEQEEQLKLLWEVLLKQTVMRSQEEKLGMLEKQVVQLQQLVWAQEEFLARDEEQYLATLDPSAPVFLSKHSLLDTQAPKFVPKSRTGAGSYPKISMDVAAAEFVPKILMGGEVNNNQDVEENNNQQDVGESDSEQEDLMTSLGSVLPAGKEGDRGIHQVQSIRPKLILRVDSAASPKLKHAG